MKRYQYDKKKLKGLSLLPFVQEADRREKIIQETDAEEIQTEFAANRVAKALHPSHLCLKVIAVESMYHAKTYTLAADQEKGTRELAFFRAGQYLVVAFPIASSFISRPYTIASSPKEALGPDGIYRITVKETPDGFVSSYILSHWEVGTEVLSSGPLGQFYYQHLRDREHVIACAGGSGITPFLSMAEAIADGTEQFRLTILYGARTEQDLLHWKRLSDIAENSKGLVKIVPVLSEEEKNGWKHGFLSAERIQEESQNEPYSLFVCGPKPMYSYLEQQVTLLGLPRKAVRWEAKGGYGVPERHPDYPKEAAGKTFQLTVMVHGETYHTAVSSEEPVLVAVERAGIFAPADCRSGQCGWCHSRLISGNVFTPPEVDGRRFADRKFGWIHPCVSYALSDLTIEVFPIG